MNIGHFIDAGLYFTIGIFGIILSVKKKERLANMAALIRFAGIIAIASGLFYFISAVFNIE